jgi:hypothetical protein
MHRGGLGNNLRPTWARFFRVLYLNSSKNQPFGPSQPNHTGNQPTRCKLLKTLPNNSTDNTHLGAPYIPCMWEGHVGMFVLFRKGTVEQAGAQQGVQALCSCSQGMWPVPSAWREGWWGLGGWVRRQECPCHAPSAPPQCRLTWCTGGLQEHMVP